MDLSGLSLDAKIRLRTLEITGFDPRGDTLHSFINRIDALATYIISGKNIAESRNAWVFKIINDGILQVNAMLLETQDPGDREMLSAARDALEWVIDQTTNVKDRDGLERILSGKKGEDSSDPSKLPSTSTLVTSGIAGISLWDRFVSEVAKHLYPAEYPSGREDDNRLHEDCASESISAVLLSLHKICDTLPPEFNVASGGMSGSQLASHVIASLHNYIRLGVIPR